jgi:hypothetical protein
MRAAARRARDESVAPAQPRPSDRGFAATARARNAPTAAHGDLRLLLPDGTTLLHLREAQARVLDGCSEDDPAVVFAWDTAALTALAAYLSAPGGAPDLPTFVPGPLAGPVTAAVVRRWIIGYAAQLQDGPQAHMAEAIIAPLTLQHFSGVQHKIAGLCYDPAMIAYAASPNAVLPLARVLIVADGQRPARTITANVKLSAFGVPVFV